MDGSTEASQRQEAARCLLDAAFVCPHTDADGLAAGAIALRARGESAEDAVILGRGATPWAPGSIPAKRPAAILDWGVRELEGPALFVDHHAPEADGFEDQIVVSGYGREPEVSTSVLMGEVIHDAPAWVVAVGAYGDLGDRAWKLPALAGMTKSHVKKLVPLVNAPRRLPDGPIRTALQILIDAEDAKGALNDPRIAQLSDAKDEWQSGLKAALRTAPDVFGNFALIRFTSPYQVHPLVAQTWARRLAPNIVIAANDDYIPGMVNFALRGGDGDLRAVLHGALPDEGGEFAHGHDRATGGSLSHDRFDVLIDKLRTS